MIKWPVAVALVLAAGLAGYTAARLLWWAANVVAFAVGHVLTGAGRRDR